MLEKNFSFYFNLSLSKYLQLMIRRKTVSIAAASPLAHFNSYGTILQFDWIMITVVHKHLFGLVSLNNKVFISVF
jgi:hypothetical protein